MVLILKNHQAYICYDKAQYASDTFTGCYQKIGYVNANTSKYASKLGYDLNHPLVAFPIETNGSNSTYISDYYVQNSGNKIALIGGRWSDGLPCGLWFWFFDSESSYNGDDAVARLLKTN